MVSASPAEARLALVRGDRVLHAWLLRSSTSLGEVQLAEPYGDGLLAVVRLWTEKQAEFRVVRLTPDGLAESFSVDRAEWAETASLSRFRLHGDTLYQLRSTPSGVEIATFEIGEPHDDPRHLRFLPGLSPGSRSRCSRSELRPARTTRSSSTTATTPG